MTYGELIQLYFERSSALQMYWTIYVIVIGGLLAFSSLRKQPDAVTGVLVTVLFVFFAYKNLGAIEGVTIERHAVVAAIHEYPAEGDGIKSIRAKIEPTLNPPAFEGVRNFHIASDVITVLALWAMEWRRRKMAASTPA